MRKYIILLLLTMSVVAFGQTDWSHNGVINIPEPTFATVRITGVEAMPEGKTNNLQAMMEFDDGAGNTFTKRVILNAQGNSSMHWPKKNISVLLCEDMWVGDATTDLTIGNWVTQDCYHLKANYNDYFQGIGAVAYKVYDDIVATQPLTDNRPWKRAGMKGEDNQICHPEGFPCAVYLNDDFYGLFSWQLRKHRSNMNQKKAKAEHIHLDGTLWDDTFFAGDILWNQFEVRNPKSLYCMNGDVYNGDYPMELMDETSAFFDLETDDDITKEAKKNTAAVKKYIIAFSKLEELLEEKAAAEASAEEMRKMIAEYLDVKGMIDYYIFSLVTNNSDGFMKNWQWFTYDGKKWFVEPYDLDCTFGNVFTGEMLLPAGWAFFDDDYTMEKEYVNIGIMKFVLRYFLDDMKARYAELREGKTITEESLYKKVEDWMARIPSASMRDEWNRWPKRPFMQPTITNDGWKQCYDFTDWMQIPLYNPNTTYHAGDRTIIDYGYNMATWMATKDVTGVYPFQQVGYEMTADKQKDWINERIRLIDNYLDYQHTDWMNISVTANIENAKVKRFLDEVEYTYSSPEVSDNYRGRIILADEQSHQVVVPLPEMTKSPLTVSLTRCKDMSVTMMLTDVGVTNVTLYNLYPNERYTYTVMDGEMMVTQGEVNTEGRVRMIGLPDLHNCRDLGGWVTENGKTMKYGMIYRGVELHAGKQNIASAETLSDLRALGIRAELDMRRTYYQPISSDFADNTIPTVSAFGTSVPYLCVNLSSIDQMLSYYPSKFRDGFNFVVNNLKENRPVYLHCVWGADRTGLMCALMEAVLGVGLDGIYKDYVLTSFSVYSGQRDKSAMNTRLLNIIGYSPSGTKSLKECAETYMVNNLGIKREDIETFRQLMLEDGQDSPTGIVSTPLPAGNTTATYNIAGMRIKGDGKGMMLQRTSDGSVRKVVCN